MVSTSPGGSLPEIQRRGGGAGGGSQGRSVDSDGSGRRLPRVRRRHVVSCSDPGAESGSGHVCTRRVLQKDHASACMSSANTHQAERLHLAFLLCLLHHLARVLIVTNCEGLERQYHTGVPMRWHAQSAPRAASSAPSLA